MHSVANSIVPGRFEVLECLISVTDMEHALEAVLERAAARQGGYVCFANVHTVVTCKADYRFRQITNSSLMSMPDGMPLVAVGKLSGEMVVGRVAGPDFMLQLLQRGQGLRHFFYGSTPDILERLVGEVDQMYPETVVVGTYSPPFRALTDAEVQQAIDRINGAKPDIVWVGLGAPKQEYWMAEHWRQLRPAILMGVGAAFDFHAGRVRRSPAWMQRAGLEWLYRLIQEPVRLWRRYLTTNSLFIYYFLRNVLSANRFR